MHKQLFCMFYLKSCIPIFLKSLCDAKILRTSLYLECQILFFKAAKLLSETKGLKFVVRFSGVFHLLDILLFPFQRLNDRVVSSSGDCSVFSHCLNASLSS